MHPPTLDIPFYMVLPFALTLLGIAVLPLSLPHFWEHNRNKAVFVAVLALPVAAFLASRYPQGLWHSAQEYFSFVVLLGSLYTIAGGIHLAGDLIGTPLRNVAWLGAGAVLANVFGTTGASMLLIRTLLRTNHQRKRVAHIPFFFILIVSNSGGLLTPLGDPPLFLGYLRGLPFTWTLQLWPAWTMACGYLLALFFIIDSIAYGREPVAAVVDDILESRPLRIEGGMNVAILAGVVGAVFLPTPLRELAMLALSAFSYRVGSREARMRNGFTWGPILEVAVLFAGIFITMVPALMLLERHGGELGLRHPWQYFLASGMLSSVLDNAPTYLTFVSAAQGLGLPSDTSLGIPSLFLTAISLGSVLMGANTYIGNGPNFMVKAIAEECGYRMPSFGSYMVRAPLTLAPVYVFIVYMLS